ncbi:hypothetical protein GH714_015755 [Hevea brasiliensis]|uniref:CCHC-type domain-containing protein n=1 Tax=Hevea brasiliensis TaxID=3981 RepID=A0A6A6NHQ0_HEVBR|nr:hypothetical protein GH714_015755 [Hevea brasiliensis]
MSLSEHSLSELVNMIETLSCEKPASELFENKGMGHNITPNKLIVKIVAIKRYSPWILRTTMGKIWKFKVDFVVNRGPNRAFIFVFENAQDEDRIIDEGPWSLDNNLTIFKEWLPNKSLQDIHFTAEGFWVQMHGLPPSNWNCENAKRIGGLFTGLIKIDETEDSLEEWRSFFRIRVYLLIERAILTGFFLTRDGVKRDWVKFKYEYLPTFCFFCGCIGHMIRFCSNWISYNGKGDKNDSPMQFGTWLIGKSPSNILEQRSIIKRSSIPLLTRCPSESGHTSSATGRGKDASSSTVLMLELRPPICIND